MFKTIILVIFAVACASSPNQKKYGHVEKGEDFPNPSFSDKDRAEIFSSFDYINKQVWALNRTPGNIDVYKMNLQNVPAGKKKEDVLGYVNKMQMFTCPLDNNFVVCGYLKDSYTFCDDARIKMSKDRYRDYVGRQDMRALLSQQLGCN